VVITDIQVPGENGLELMEMIRIYNPGVKRIYTCGDLVYFGPFLEEEIGRYHVSILPSLSLKVN
jgi:hypothetical protein